LAGANRPSGHAGAGLASIQASPAAVAVDLPCPRLRPDGVPPRETLVRQVRDLENSVRGLLRGFGLRVPVLLRGRWSAAVRSLVEGHPSLPTIFEPSLQARETLREQLAVLDRQVRDAARDDRVCRQPMTAPGVGAIVALTFRPAIDDPHRFRSSRSVGAFLGLTPKRDQSGETDRVGAISKVGDAATRVALFEAAHVLLARVGNRTPQKTCSETAR
jgi:transposase